MSAVGARAAGAFPNGPGGRTRVHEERPPERASMKTPAGAGVGGTCPGRLRRHWQPGYLNDAMRVDQLNEPFVLMYSFVYQKVQSSTGSTVIAL